MIFNSSERKGAFIILLLIAGIIFIPRQVLPEQQKQILLRSMKGERVKEIADKMNISENTVKTQKKRAYAFVREQLDDLWVVVISMLFV